MPPLIITCPQCAMQLRVPDSMTPGTKVKCPKCAITFETPGPDVPLPVPPPAPVEHYSLAPPVPSGPRYPVGGEQANAFAGLGDDNPEYQPRPRGIDDLSPNYAIDLGEMFGRAQRHWGAVVGPMIGFIFLGGIVGGIAQAVLGIVPLIGPIIYLLMVDPQLQAGYTIVGLNELRGRRWEFGDFFGGFNYFGPLLLVRLLTILTALACLAPGGIMLIAVQDARNEVLSLVALSLLVAGIGVFVYIAVRAFTFAVPLVIDRRVGGMDAIAGSWRLTEGHFWGWLGVGMVGGLIVMAGLALCFVGILLAQPLAVLLGVAGFLQIAGGRKRLDEMGPM